MTANEPRLNRRVRTVIVLKSLLMGGIVAPLVGVVVLIIWSLLTRPFDWVWSKRVFPEMVTWCVLTIGYAILSAGPYGICCALLVAWRAMKHVSSGLHGRNLIIGGICFGLLLGAPFPLWWFLVSGSGGWSASGLLHLSLVFLGISLPTGAISAGLLLGWLRKELHALQPSRGGTC